jgi:hypothetical protein
MPVDGPRQERFEGDVPKDLHGLTSVKLYLAQVVDPRGYRRVVMITRIPNDAGPDKLLTFPEDFWRQMGVLPAWLEERVRKILIPEKAEAAKSQSQKRHELVPDGKQLPEDNVDVIAGLS